MENDTPGIPQAAYPDTIDGLRQALRQRLESHPYGAYSPELLRALIAVFDLVIGQPVEHGTRVRGRRLRVVR